MNEVFVWIKDLFIVIICLSFFEILIPNTQMEKYIKFIFSLVILAMIVEPIVYFLSKCNI